jgi:hypothetical protein
MKANNRAHENVPRRLAMLPKDRRPETGIVSTAFIHDDLVRKPVSIDGLFEKDVVCHFIKVLGKHKIDSEGLY